MYYYICIYLLLWFKSTKTSLMKNNHLHCSKNNSASSSSSSHQNHWFSSLFLNPLNYFSCSDGWINCIKISQTRHGAHTFLKADPWCVYWSEECFIPELRSTAPSAGSEVPHAALDHVFICEPVSAKKHSLTDFISCSSMDSRDILTLRFSFTGSKWFWIW